MFLDRLSEFMNFERLCADPPIFATMDHRAVLVAAWAATSDQLFNDQPPLLLRLDAHPDMGEPPRHWASEKARLTDLSAVHDVVNNQRKDDGGWVISAMQFGFAGDVVSLFVHDYHRFPGDCGEYEDHTGVTHRLGTYASLSDLLEMRETNWRLQSILEPLEEGNNTPVWVDFDLDFATGRSVDGSPVPWTSQDWETAFGLREQAFLEAALQQAELITLALEPWFCGGMAKAGDLAGELGRRFRHAFGKL